MPTAAPSPAIAVLGAGAIGCWMGGRLAAGGAAVTLIGRPRLAAELAGGLVTTELDGPERRTPLGTGPGAIRVAASADAARGADLVLVTVKSAQTAEAGAELAAALPPGPVVISLQNGVRNPAVLRAALPAHRVLAGMVPFNVIRRGPGALHRASDGVVRIDADPAAAPLVRACRRSGVACEARADMVAVHWGKLVLNLNNAINALSGLPLADQLGRRPYRRCLAAAQREALAVLARARVPVARVTALPPGWIPPLLGTPDRVFRVLGRRVVAIDPAARSSMWDDLEARRPTEIDYLQGEIIELAARCGMRAPVNSALAALVRAAEAGGRRDLSGPELLAALALTP